MDLGGYDPLNDPDRRHSKSKDPAWKYGSWADVNNKDSTICGLCSKLMLSGGARRLKHHLAGGFTDVITCPNTTSTIMKEMRDYLKNNARKTPVPVDDEIEDDGNDGIINVVSLDETSLNVGNKSSSEASTLKRKKVTSSFTLPKSKSVASMIRKTPEEVVEGRHSKGPHQTILENYTKSPEEKNRVEMHIANFFYENGIPFNVANSRSYEVMVESIGQFGPGLKPPSFHKLRVPLLEKAKSETGKLREAHEKSWKLYGCTLMCDGWTDKRTRHLINFLVNSQEGTFFLSSTDVSSEVQDACMLADLIEVQINLIGKENVIQIVTDNGANFKAAGRKLCDRILTLYWTPCAAHCLDLMLEDIAKIKAFSVCITHARNITTFIYRHGRLLSQMREKTSGKDIVRPGATRFATAFLTLQSLWGHKDALRKLFGGDAWFNSKLATTTAGEKVHDAVFSTRFWNVVGDCIRASQPLLVVLRAVDGDEKPAMPEVCELMIKAMTSIKEHFVNNQRLLKDILRIVEKRWESQMKVDLHEAALYLHPGKFFDLKERDHAYAARLRMKFNEVLEKMVADIHVVDKISGQADQYENLRGNFGSRMAYAQRASKNPIDWWGAFGGYTVELMVFAKRIVGLCFSSSGCERNWSTFEFIHTKKRNRLEHQRLNDLVYVQYNRKIATRFQMRREQGTDFNPLNLEDFQWDNEWVNGDVVNVAESELWQAVDSALDASRGLENRQNSRRNEARDHGSSSQMNDPLNMEMEGYAHHSILNDDMDIENETN
ncbi:unnamed protein product [Rhodiola kirilowii]